MKVLYFSTVNWKWIKQRPHFLCEYLSDEGIEVTYFSITPFLKQHIVNKQINKFLLIKDRFVLPYGSKLLVIKKLNIMYVKFLLKKKYDIIILTHPEQYEYLPNKLKNSTKIIYECMDNIPYFYKEDKIKIIEKKEKYLCRQSEQIITSSDYLKNKIINKYKIEVEKATVIKNALDKSLIKNNEPLIELKYPNLMYIGTISNWLDMDILERYARENPKYTIYIIGPIEKNMKKINESNIVLLGAVKHVEVSRYIKSGQIMLIPFKVNELIKGVDPVKLYEYLSFNKPVITSYWNELNQYNDNELVYFYKDYTEFKHAVEKIENKTNEYKKIDNNFIEENTWKQRVVDYLEVLKKVY